MRAGCKKLTGLGGRENAAYQIVHLKLPIKTQYCSNGRDSLEIPQQASASAKGSENLMFELFTQNGF